MTVSAPRLICRIAGMAAMMLVSGLSAGCTTTGAPTSLVNHGPPGTVAFESIDGLPEGQFHKLVQRLLQEAEARQLAVVSRTQPAQYRVRGYAAAHVRGKSTTISWVWDIYDADRQRTLRIAGEEVGGGGRGGWAAADDSMMDRIARSGMAQLAGFLGAPANAPPAPATPSDPAPAPALVAQGAPTPVETGSPAFAETGFTAHAALGNVQP
ncbi:MAG TPA: hypothetical protein VNR11_06290 [Xanthobacteraceae bacterium]|nr:hypothetical protein [Xanthobacteraceae bacterium]